MIKKEFPLVSVHIDRKPHVITVEVPEHEVRVLRHVHGGLGATANKVKVMGPATTPSAEPGQPPTVDTILLNASAEAEFVRLQNSYRRINTPDMVVAAYPGGAEDLAQFGFSTGGALEEVPRSLYKKHPKAKPEGAEAPKPAKAAKTEPQGAAQ